MATYKCCISIMIGSNSTGNLVDCITIQNEILLEGKRGVMCQKNAGLGQGMGVTPKFFFVRHRTSPFLHWQWQCCSAAVDPASRRLNGTHLGTPRAPAQSRPHVRIYDKLHSGRRVALVTVVIQGARPSVITAVTGLRSLAWPQAQASLTIMFKQRFAQRLPTRAL